MYSPLFFFFLLFPLNLMDPNKTNSAPAPSPRPRNSAPRTLPLFYRPLQVYRLRRLKKSFISFRSATYTLPPPPPNSVQHKNMIPGKEFSPFFLGTPPLRTSEFLLSVQPPFLAGFPRKHSYYLDPGKFMYSYLFIYICRRFLTKSRSG